MEMSMKEILKIRKEMVKDQFFLKMVNIIQEIGKIIINRQNDKFNGEGIHHFNDGTIYIG